MLIDPHKYPTFCQILRSTETFMNKMQVPPCFIKENKKMLTKTCLLKTDVAGIWWKVKIVREKLNYFICEEDWSQFVLHHQLKQGDILLFFLVEKSTFHVQPYTKKCYKNIVHKRQDLYEKLSSSSEEETSDPSNSNMEIVASDSSLDILDQSAKNLSYGPLLVEKRKIQEGEEEHDIPINIQTNATIIEEEEDDIPVNLQINANIIEEEESLDKNVSEANSGSDEDGPKNNSRYSLVNFDCDDPYFEIVIKKTHTNFMTIPMRFAARTNIIDLKNMRLVNEKGKEWGVEIEHKRRAVRIKRGWAEFRRQNKIATGETCRFKLIQGHAANILQVHKIPTPRSLQHY